MICSNKEKETSGLTHKIFFLTFNQNHISLLNLTKVIVLPEPNTDGSGSKPFNGRYILITQ